MAEPVPEEGKPEGAAQVHESMAEAGGSLLHTLRTLAADVADLVVLEIRLAGLSLTTMLALGVAVGVLLVTTWLLVMGAIAAWLVVPDTTWGGVLALMSLLNLITAIGLVALIRWRSRDLLFSRTRRQLSPRPSEPTA